MTRKSIVATILEATGILTIAWAVGFVSIWGGILTLGAGLVAFGIAIERGEG